MPVKVIYPSAGAVMVDPDDGIDISIPVSDGIAKWAAFAFPVALRLDRFVSAFPVTSLASSVMSIRPESTAASKALMQGNRVKAGGWTVSELP